MQIFLIPKTIKNTIGTGTSGEGVFPDGYHKHSILIQDLEAIPIMVVNAE